MTLQEWDLRTLVTCWNGSRRLGRDKQHIIAILISIVGFRVGRKMSRNLRWQ
jgi:hypothetical protein